MLYFYFRSLEDQLTKNGISLEYFFYKLSSENTITFSFRNEQKEVSEKETVLWDWNIKVLINSQTNIYVIVLYNKRIT